MCLLFPTELALLKISLLFELMLHFPGNIDTKPKVNYLVKLVVDHEINGYVVYCG